MTEAAHQMASNPLPPACASPGSVGPAGRSRDRGRSTSAGDALAAGQRRARSRSAGANVIARLRGQSRGERGGVRRRLVPHRRRGLHRRRRLPVLIAAGSRRSSTAAARRSRRARSTRCCSSIPPSARRSPSRCLTRRSARTSPPRSCSPTAHAPRSRRSREFAGGRLAGFKVPRRIVLLDELPKGATGKVQRIGLAERLGLGGVAADGATPRPPYAAPGTEREQAVAALWSDLLDVAHVGLHDDFFALGGDSIAAAELMATIAERGWTPGELAPGTLLLAPTLERFAGLLDRSDLRLGGSMLLPLRTGDDSLEPLFLVHTHEGHVLHYLPLAHSLAAERPVWAFEASTDGRRRAFPGSGSRTWRRRTSTSSVPSRPPAPTGSAEPAWAVSWPSRWRASSRRRERWSALALLINPSPGPRGSARRARAIGVVAAPRARSLSTGSAATCCAGSAGRCGAGLDRARTPAARARRPALTPADQRFRAQMAAARDSYVPSRFDGTIAVIRAPRYGIPCSYWRRLAGRVLCENLPSSPPEQSIRPCSPSGSMPCSRLSAPTRAAAPAGARRRSSAPCAPSCGPAPS